MLSACGGLILTPSYTPQNMITLPTQQTTHCIGRYLIDLPSNFVLSTGGWGDIELYYGLDKNFQRVYATVKPKRYTSEEFWSEVNKRRFELRDTKNQETNASMLIYEEQMNPVSALLRRLPDEISASAIKTEVHVLVRDRYVTLEQESYSKSQTLSEIYYKNVDPITAETRLKMIASKLLPYQAAERARPGFCMHGVLFDVGQDDETATFRFRAKEVPDLHLDVDYHAVTGQPSEGLIERIKKGFKAYPLVRSAVTTLRERKTQLGGDAAEESLTKTTRPGTQHVFDIERRDDQPRTLDRPFFSITLTTGKEYRSPMSPEEGNLVPYTDMTFYSPQDKVLVHRADNATLSDEQVLKLWNETVASVRKR